MENKYCSLCQIDKPISEFFYRKDNKRYRTYCKVCWKIKTKEWKNSHPDEVKEYYSRYNHSEKNSKNQQRYYQNNHEYKLWSSAKARAKAKNIPFTLNISDIIIPEVCPILGVPLKYNTKVVQDNSATIDRIIPELGYIPSNIQIISHKANAMKYKATPEELLQFARWIHKTYES